MSLHRVSVERSIAGPVFGLTDSDEFDFTQHSHLELDSGGHPLHRLKELQFEAGSRDVLFLAVEKEIATANDAQPYPFSVLAHQTHGYYFRTKSGLPRNLTAFSSVSALRTDRKLHTPELVYWMDTIAEIELKRFGLESLRSFVKSRG